MQVNYKTAKSLVKIAMMANRPILIWGPPGVGKTSLGREVAKELSARYIDQRASTMEPTDVRGLMQTEEGRTVYCPPKYLPTDNGESVVLTFDELNTAHHQTQQALYELFLDRALNGVELGDQVRLIGMCNRAMDRSFVNQIPAALGTRVIHINLFIEADEWIEWAFKNQIDPLVIAYIKLYEDRLFAFDGEAIGRSDSKAFPCPRTWEIMSDSIKQSPNDSKILTPLACGIVGEQRGLEFAAFAELSHQMPDIEKILKNPAKAPLPKDGAIKMMLSTALVSRFSKDTIKSILTYLSRMQAEYAVYAVRSAMLVNPGLIVTPEFSAWSQDHTQSLSE